MNNKYTRKEEACPLQNGFCEHDGGECDKCIREEEMFWEEEWAFNGTKKQGFQRRYTVLNERDYAKYVRVDLREEFEDVLSRVLTEIKFGRVAHGKHIYNNYVVINLDEPYIDEIIEIMRRNGHWG